MTQETSTAPTPTIDEEITAIRAVLEALVKLPKEAQGRVLAHARMYLGGMMDSRW